MIHLDHGLILGVALFCPGLRIMLILGLGRIGVNGVKIGHSVGF